MPIKGHIHKYGNDVNTDVIFPGRYLNITDPDEMAKHAMEDLDPGFIKKVKQGDIIIAGKNFGCGSSREQAATCLLKAGISCIIAESFSRIFYRNTINKGLPIVIAPKITQYFEDGDEAQVDFESGNIKNLRTGQEIQGTPIPPFVLQIVRDGGLISHLKKKLSGG
ncbi:MAG: 3-isopropylmalate dehydratase small subunit [Candidatus Eremiobacteraeota bacterium]|nr:3-isopropylmalate dehydratase small subunit [Candidatus Eremiobacteraeota bacterium]